MSLENLAYEETIFLNQIRFLNTSKGSKIDFFCPKKPVSHLKLPIHVASDSNRNNMVIIVHLEIWSKLT